MIWCCSNDWVDQFFNPGHQAKHHILKCLAITEETQCTPSPGMPVTYRICTAVKLKYTAFYYFYAVVEASILQLNMIKICVSDNMMAMTDVVKCLLQHVGSMCLHQINNDLLHTPLGPYIQQQHPVDIVHAARVCDVLDQAMQSGDKKIIICGLIVLQVRWFPMKNYYVNTVQND